MSGGNGRVVPHATRLRPMFTPACEYSTSLPPSHSSANHTYAEMDSLTRWRGLRWTPAVLCRIISSDSVFTGTDDCRANAAACAETLALLCRRGKCEQVAGDGAIHMAIPFAEQFGCGIRAGRHAGDSKRDLAAAVLES